MMPLTVVSSAGTGSTSLDNRTIHSGSSDPDNTVTCEGSSVIGSGELFQFN